MIVFVDLGAQLSLGAVDFAFFDAVTERFLEFNKEQAWHSVRCFEQAVAEDPFESAENCLELIPAWWPETYEDAEHAIRCRVCRELFDARDLAAVFDHEHDGAFEEAIRVSRSPAAKPGRRVERLDCDGVDLHVDLAGLPVAQGDQRAEEPPE